jgi:hypothetical protein
MSGDVLPLMQIQETSCESNHFPSRLSFCESPPYNLKRKTVFGEKIR